MTKRALQQPDPLTAAYVLAVLEETATEMAADPDPRWRSVGKVIEAEADGWIAIFDRSVVQATENLGVETAFTTSTLAQTLDLCSDWEAFKAEYQATSLPEPMPDPGRHGRTEPEPESGPESGETGSSGVID